MWGQPINFRLGFRVHTQFKVNILSKYPLWTTRPIINKNELYNLHNIHYKTWQIEQKSSYQTLHIWTSIQTKTQIPLRQFQHDTILSQHDSTQIHFHQEGGEAGARAKKQRHALQLQRTPAIQCVQQRNACTVLIHPSRDRHTLPLQKKMKTLAWTFWQTLKRKRWSTTALDNKAGIAIHPRVLPEKRTDTVTQPTPYSFHGSRTVRPKELSSFWQESFGQTASPSFNLLINNLHQNQDVISRGPTIKWALDSCSIRFISTVRHHSAVYGHIVPIKAKKHMGSKIEAVFPWSDFHLLSGDVHPCWSGDKS